MLPPLCPLCGKNIESEPLMCDGICGEGYHPACLPRRVTRSGQCSPFTCQTCADIKPCHVLKAFGMIGSSIDAIVDRLLSLEHSIQGIRSDLKIISDERESAPLLDDLHEKMAVLTTVTNKVADTTHRNNLATSRLVDTVMELSVSPELATLKEDVSEISNSLSGLGRKLRSLTSLAPSAPITPSPPARSGNTSPSPSPSTSSHTIMAPAQPSAPSNPLLPPPTTSSLKGQPHSSPSPVRSLPTPPPIPNTHTQPSAPSGNVSWIPADSLQTSSFYVGKCHTLTTEEQIRTYMSTELQIPLRAIRCRKLVSPSRPLDEYTFVSFKVSLPSTLTQKVLSHTWPHDTQVTVFRNKRRTPRAGDNAPTPPPPKNASFRPEQGAT